MEIELCEDTPGDCAVAGYRTAPKKTTHQRHRFKGIKSGTSDEYPSEASVESKEVLDQKSSSESTISAVLVVAAILIAIVLFGGLFGLDTRTSLLAFFAGSVLGLLGVGDRRRRYRGWW